jgi:hypothetical protein
MSDLENKTNNEIFWYKTNESWLWSVKTTYITKYDELII